VEIYCKNCKRKVTTKFRIWYFLAMFLILPAIGYYLIHPVAAYILFLVVIVAAFCGVFSVCPICNTPHHKSILEAFKPKK